MKFVVVLEKMGVKVEWIEYLVIVIGVLVDFRIGKRLKFIDVDMNVMFDVVMILVVLGFFLDGFVVIWDGILWYFVFMFNLNIWWCFFINFSFIIYLEEMGCK